MERVSMGEGEYGSMGVWEKVSHSHPPTLPHPTLPPPHTPTPRNATFIE